MGSRNITAEYGVNQIVIGKSPFALVVSMQSQGVLGGRTQGTPVQRP